MLSNSPMRLSRSCLSILFIFSVLSVSSCCNVFAASTINVQGKLTDIKGNPITGIKDLYFRIYNSDSIVAAPLWTEQHNYNLGNDGLFNVRLGKAASLDTLSFDKQLYLGISINGENEMTPRQVLTSSPYALGSIGDFSVGKKLLVGGNVGIGTASPGRKLHINAGGNPSDGIRLETSITDGANLEWRTGEGTHWNIDNYTGGLLRFFTEADDETGGVVRMAISSKTGNVGIGTAGPGAKLEVTDSASTTIRIKPLSGTNNLTSNYDFWGTFYNYPSDTGVRRVANIQAGFSTGVWGTEYMAFGVGNAGVANDAANPPLEAMRITSYGNVGIGTANPTKKLEVNGTLSWNLEYFESPEYSVPYFADGQNNTVKVADLTWKFCYLSSYSHDGSNSAYARVYRGADGWYLNYGKPPSSKGGISVRVSGVK